MAGAEVTRLQMLWKLTGLEAEDLRILLFRHGL